MSTQYIIISLLLNVFLLKAVVTLVVFVSLFGLFTRSLRSLN